jgi:hypothetical protein
MPIIIFAFLWPIFSAISFLLGFMIGRSARKLPMLDSNLPWTLHWGEILPDDPKSEVLDETRTRPLWPGN